MSVDKTVRFEDEQDQQGYVMLPNTILFSGLSDGAVRVYAALIHHAREKEECWPGQARLAGMIGISEARIRVRLRELEDAGLIAIRKPGQGKTNRYIIRRSRTSISGGLEPPKTNDKGEEEKKTKETTNGGVVDEIFNHYLSAFPKKRQKKADAGQRKTILNALEHGTADELKKCIDLCAASEWHQQGGHNSISLILAPKTRGKNYPSGRSQREQIEFWLSRDTAPKKDRSEWEAWNFAMAKYEAGEGEHPGPEPTR